MYIRNDIRFVKLETEVCSSLAHVKGERLWIEASFNTYKITVGIVYMSVNKYKQWNLDLNKLLLSDLESHRERGADRVLLVGDFNADPLQPDNSGRKQNIKLLEQLTDEASLKIVNLLKPSWSRSTWSARASESMIDLALGTDAFCRGIRNFTVDDKNAFGIRSDHRFIKISLDTKIDVPKIIQGEPGWKLSTFRELGDWTAYGMAVETSLLEMNERERATVSSQNDAIVSALVESADSVIGKSSGVFCNRKGYTDPFWDGYLEQASRRRHQCVANLQAARRKEKHGRREQEASGSSLTAKAASELKAANSSFRSLLRKKKKAYDDRCLRLVKIGRDCGRPFYNIIQEREDDFEIVTLTDGVKTSNTTDSMKDLITDYWGDIFSSKGLQIDFPTLHGRFCQQLMGPISIPEVTAAVNKLKNGKAAGADKIPSDLVKNGGIGMISELTELFNRVIQNLEVPEAWANLRTKLIHKKGDRAHIGNKRPLSLTSNIGKPFMRILAWRLEDVVEQANCLGQLQNGFRGQRGTSNNLLILSHLIEHSKRLKKPLYVAFLDLTKAYDSVEWCVVWDALAQIGIDLRFIKLLRLLYENSQCNITLSQLVTGVIKITRGVRQGCVLSPLLFAIVLSIFTRQLEGSGRGACFAGGRIPALCYADDICLFANSPRALQALLNSANTFADRVGLTFSPDKCKVIQFGARFDNSGEPKEFLLGKVRLEVVDSMTYLGVQFSNGKNYLELFEKKLINRAKYWVYEVKRIAEASFSKYTVGRTIWKSTAVPALTYGLDVLLVRKHVIDQLDKFQNRMARILLGSNSFAATEALQGDMGWSSFSYRVKRARIAARHRIEHSPDLISRRIIDAGVGRAFTQISGDMGELAIDEAEIPLRQNISLWVKSRADVVERNHWAASMEQKTTLKLYRVDPDICDCSNLYDNHTGSMVLFKFRAGCFETLERTTKFKRLGWAHALCPCCAHSVPETQEHILLHCRGYDVARKKWLKTLGSLIEGFDEMEGVELLRACLALGFEPNNKAVRVSTATKNFLVTMVRSRREALKSKRCQIERFAVSLLLAASILASILLLPF